MIRRGRLWEEPGGRPDLVLEGGDPDLAGAVADRRGAGVEYRPTGPSDLARTVGLGARRSGLDSRPGAAGEARELPGSAPHARDALSLDLLLVDGAGARGAAVSSVVLGTAPHRIGLRSRPSRVAVLLDGRTVHDGPALGVVAANAQFLDGANVAPRGHPGDGRFELQVYLPVRRAERAELRRRVRTGDHLPHPRITQRTARHAIVHAGRPWAVALDGVTSGSRSRVEITLRGAAYRLLL